jgi:hypothetical protein
MTEYGTETTLSRCYRVTTWDEKPHRGAQPGWTPSCTRPWQFLIGEEAAGTRSTWPLAGEGEGCEGGALVSSRIIQTERWEVYPSSLRIKRPSFKSDLIPPDRTGQQISGFSDQSRSRLRFTSINAAHILTAQFCMTYHEYWPVNGREFKRQVNLFLTRMRKQFPGVQYLWIGEFQTRGAPHLHLFLNLPVTRFNHEWLAKTWHHIADPHSDHHLWWHLDRVEASGQSAFIPWQIGGGGYLVKYLDKSHQKSIPDGFRSFGRWWGNSQKLVPDPETFERDSLAVHDWTVQNTTTGEYEEFRAAKWLHRHIGRYQEKVTHGRTWFRRTAKSTTALSGAPIFRQLLDYIKRQKVNPGAVPF